MTIQKNKAKPFARSERATARKALALIIAFSLVITNFSISSYASAAASEIAWEAFWAVMKNVFTSQTSSFISSAVYEAVDKTVGAYENLQTVIDDTNSSIFNLAQVNEPIQFWRSEDRLNYRWQVNTGVNMTASEQEAAEYMVDWLNSNVSGSEIANQIDNDGNLAVHGYEIAKELAAKSYTSYLESTIKSAGYSFDSGDALASTGSLPTYSFDFIGPKQGITIPTKTGSVSLSKDGYTFSAPLAHVSRSGFPKTWVESNGYKGSFISSDGNYYAVCYTTNAVNCYSASQYVIFNGEIYYHYLYQVSTTPASRTFSLPTFYNKSGEYNGSFKAFKSSSGVLLSTVASESDISSMYVGYVYSTQYTGELFPGYVDTSDFFTTLSGGTTDIPVSDDEQSISDSLGVGLINDDSKLTIDENGNIISADGIPIGKLSDLVEMLKNGTLQFEDIQSYLQTISTLVSNGNLTAQQQKVLLDNVNTKVNDLSGDISKINENIASIAKSLELDKTQNLDFDVPSSTIIDKFPFSIPFDFYNIITLLVENPKEPIFNININTDMNVGGISQKVNESIKLDLTIFKYNGYDIVRIITNATSIILFSLCLVSGTKKLIWK